MLEHLLASNDITRKLARQFGRNVVNHPLNGRSRCLHAVVCAWRRGGYCLA